LNVVVFNKTINQEHIDANSKTKQSTKKIKMPTPKQNNQPGANRCQLHQEGKKILAYISKYKQP
jgi:hypothetical protein